MPTFIHRAMPYVDRYIPFRAIFKWEQMIKAETRAELIVTKQDKTKLHSPEGVSYVSDGRYPSQRDRKTITSPEEA